MHAGGEAELVTAAQASVSIIDALGLTSATRMLPIADAMESGRSETCATRYVCADAFTCSRMLCVIPPAAMATCAGASSITLAPGPATTTASATGSIPAARGNVLGSCGNTAGAEVLYTVTIPAASARAIGYDLVATIDAAATGSADTVLYVQGDLRRSGERRGLQRRRRGEHGLADR